MALRPAPTKPRPGPLNQGKSAPKTKGVTGKQPAGKEGGPADVTSAQTVSLPAGKPTMGHTTTSNSCY
jgi:hypothetical protein